MTTHADTSPPRHIALVGVNYPTAIHMTSGKTLTIKQDIPNQSTDLEDVSRHATTATYSDVTNLVMRGLKTADGLYQTYVAIRPDMEAPHTLIASLMRSCIMNS